LTLLYQTTLAAVSRFFMSCLWVLTAVTGETWWRP